MNRRSGTGSPNGSAGLVCRVDALTAGYSYLMLSTVPAFGFFPEVFGQTAGQFAYQSVWLVPQGDPPCPLCGDARIDPAALSEVRASEPGRVEPVPAPAIFE